MVAANANGKRDGEHNSAPIQAADLFYVIEQPKSSSFFRWPKLKQKLDVDWCVTESER